MAIVAADKLLTAEEYGQLPDLGRPTELVRGRIVETFPLRATLRYAFWSRICSKGIWKRTTLATF